MKNIPYNIKYIIITLAVALAFNQGVYNGVRLITHSMHHSDLSLPVDNMIPFLPWTVVIYVGAFLVWLIFYSIIAWGTSEELESYKKAADTAGGADRDRFFAADVLSKIICLVFFIVIPTTLERPVPGTDNLWETLLTFIYQIDSADNLFPSIHCAVSWLCWVGMRSRRDLPGWLRYLALILAILVCVSTLTTRQHVIVDIFGGIILAELCYLLTGFDGIRKLYAVPMKKLVGIFTK